MSQLPWNKVNPCGVGSRGPLWIGVLPGREHPSDLRPLSRALVKRQKGQKGADPRFARSEAVPDPLTQNKLDLVINHTVWQEGWGQPWEEWSELGWSRGRLLRKGHFLESLWQQGLGVGDNQAEGGNSVSTALKWPSLYRCCTAVPPVHPHMWH